MHILQACLHILFQGGQSTMPQVRSRANLSRQEAHENVIRFPEDSPLGLAYILAHLYGYSLASLELFPILEDLGIDTSDDLDGLLSTVLLARKYELPDLEHEAVRFLRGLLISRIDTLTLDANACTAVRRVYEEEELGFLRPAIVHAVNTNKKDLRVDMEDFGVLLDQLPQLARDLAIQALFDPSASSPSPSDTPTRSLFE